MMLLLFPILLLAIPSSSASQSPTYSDCAAHDYKIHIFSHDPLIIYISNFITSDESSHLRNISVGTFRASQIADSTGQQKLATTRTSRSTSLPSDEVTRCISQRALSFQGFDTSPTQLEPLQLVQYSVGESYAPHTDWFTSPFQSSKEFGGNRLTSFFVYVSVSSDIMGGGTQFPLLDAPRDEQWCEDIVDCDRPLEDGVVFRAREGAAVFWRNLRDVKGGRVGDRRTMHAGMPVQRGAKLGMNIWTREGVLDAKFRSV